VKRSKKGQSLVEYVLILALISIVSITILNAVGKSIKGVFEKVNSSLTVSTNTQNPVPSPVICPPRSTYCP
jgi:Flp pilus assembly pilin Flp